MRELYYFISAAAIALGLASCNKGEATLTPEQPADQQITIIANTESGVDTKTYLSGDDAKGYRVLWSEDDDIYLNYTGNPILTLTDGAGTTTGTFVGNYTLEDGEYDVFYSNSGIDFSQGTSWLSETIEYIGGNVIKTAPMKGKVIMKDGAASVVNFKNLCGMLRLTLKGSDTVKEIIVYADQPVAGAYKIKEDDSLEMGYGSEVSDKITLKCKDGVALSDNGIDFYIPLPPNVYSGVKIQVKDSKGIICTRVMKAGRTLNIERSQITPISLTVSRPEVPADALSGVFTVKDPDGVINSGDEKKVYFSKGNLYCEAPASEVEFKFEENQYDFPIECVYNAVNHVGHFYWSKNASIAYGMEYYNPVRYDARHDVLFTNNPADPEKPNDNFTVNGVTGRYRALSKEEWEYLFAHHSHRRVTIEGFTVKDNIELKGCVIAPDNEELEEDKFSYTPEELVEKNLVFLPAAGFRWGYGFVKRGGIDGNYYYEGYYWSSSPDPVGNSNNNEFDAAYYFKLTNDNNAAKGVFNCGLWGFCIRLVTDVNYERPLASSDIEKPEDSDNYDWE